MRYAEYYVYSRDNGISKVTGLATCDRSLSWIYVDTYV